MFLLFRKGYWNILQYWQKGIMSNRYAIFQLQRFCFPITKSTYDLQDFRTRNIHKICKWQMRKLWFGTNKKITVSSKLQYCVHNGHNSYKYINVSIYAAYIKNQNPVRYLKKLLLCHVVAVHIPWIYYEEWQECSDYHNSSVWLLWSEYDEVNSIIDIHQYLQETKRSLWHHKGNVSKVT